MYNAIKNVSKVVKFMKKAISLFIMDVTSSTKHENRNELSEYLSIWEDILNSLENDNPDFTIKVNYRMGDEILLVADDYATAYLIANYMFYLWKYPKNRPYFGLSNGVINDSIEDIDLEKWNHPLIKEARLANDSIKNTKHRQQAIKVYENKNLLSDKKIINHILKLQYYLAEKQTKKQKEITGLYMLYGAQNTLATLLNKTTATISNQFTSGATSLIIESIEQLQEMLMLEQFETHNSLGNLVLKERLNSLQENLRKVLIKNINKITELNKTE